MSQQKNTNYNSVFNYLQQCLQLPDSNVEVILLCHLFMYVSRFPSATSWFARFELLIHLKKERKKESAKKSICRVFIFTRWMPACVIDVFSLYVGEWCWSCAVCDERVVLKNIDANIVVQKGNLLVVCYQFHPCTCFVLAISFIYVFCSL